MKLASLFSGGKDSVYAAYLAKEAGHSIDCLISIYSKNKDSYMFHTPSIDKTKMQAEVMGIPLLVEETTGEKEVELQDLRNAITRAVEEYKIEGVITGAIASVYQASRIQKICNELEIECFNPLWQKNEKEYIRELVDKGFKTVLVGVFAYPLNESWLLRKIDDKFIEEIGELHSKYDLHVAGEGGEFESFVLNCPMFSRPLEITESKISQEGENSFRAEIEVK